MEPHDGDLSMSGLRNPLLSVVTITKDDCSGLRRTVESVAAQSSSNMEQVEIDGGSKDGTLRYLASLDPSYSFRFASEPDRGIFDAMNKGVRQSKGELVVFLNGGDSFACQHVVQFVTDDWEQNRWEWAYGDINFCVGGLPRESVSRRPFDRKKLYRGTSWVPHQATFMRRSLLESLGPFRLEFGEAADQGLIVGASIRAMPRELPRVIANFELGGAHSRMRLWSREYYYHLMSEHYDVKVGGTTLTDWSFTAAAIAYRVSRRQASKVKRFALAGGRSFIAA